MAWWCVAVASAFVALGAYALIGQHDVALCFFLVLVGLAPLAPGGWLLLDRGDGGFGRERDAIARQLALLLADTPAGFAR